MSNLYREPLSGMAAEEIVEAYRSGRFNAFLHGERQPEPPKVDPTTGDTTGNLYREDLAGMSPEEIVEAKRAGRLDALLRGERRPEPAPESPRVDPSAGDTAGNLYREDLVGMSPDEIVEAKRTGRLDALLRGERRSEPEPEPKPEPEPAPEPESEPESEPSTTGDPERLS